MEKSVVIKVWQCKDCKAVFTPRGKRCDVCGKSNIAGKLIELKKEADKDDNRLE